MNKNMKLGIAVLMVALFVGLTYGALVDYLSNKVTADIKVTSPMQVGVSLGKDSWSTTYCLNTDPNDPNYNEMVLSFPEGVNAAGVSINDWAWSDWERTEAKLVIDGVFGGETVTIYLMSRNLGDGHICGFEEVIVTNDDGVTSADFESVVVRTDSIYGDLGYGEEHDLITDGFHQLDAKRVLFGDLSLSDWGAREMDVIKIEVTFEEAAFGTYTFTYRVIPDIPTL